MSKLFNVLVIEDNIDHIAIIKNLNKDYGFGIKTAKNFSQYMDLMIEETKKSYDLILCDIYLDHPLEGLEILKEFRQSGRKGKIIAYTTNEKKKDFFINQGFDDMIAKNFIDLKKLFTSIKNQMILENPVITKKISF